MAQFTAFAVEWPAHLEKPFIGLKEQIRDALTHQPCIAFLGIETAYEQNMLQEMKMSERMRVLEIAQARTQYR